MGEVWCVGVCHSECVCDCVVMVGSTRSGLARHFSWRRLGLRQATRCQLTAVHARNCLAGDGQSSHSVGLVDGGRGASRVDGETDVEIG